MSRNNTLVALFSLLCLLAACDPGGQRRLDRETMEQEKRRREPVRLKEGQIVEAARAQGQAIVKLLQGNNSLTDSSCCLTIPQPFLDSLERAQQLSIKCYAIEENPTADEALEQQLLEAYQYNREQGLPLQDNVQALGQDHFLYTAPVSNGLTTSTNCGIWSIRLNRKQVILQML